MLRVSLSFPDENSMGVAVSGGPLYRMKERFEDAEIMGGYSGPEGAPNRHYVRGIHRVDLSAHDGEPTLTKLWKDVLKGAKIVVTLDGIPEDDSTVKQYVDGMRADTQFAWA